MEKPKLYLIPTTNIQTIVKDKTVTFKYTEEPQEPIEKLDNLLLIKTKEELKLVFTDSNEVKVLIKPKDLEKYYFSNNNLKKFLDTSENYSDILSDYLYNQIEKEKIYVNKK